jgi:hypothetical protein
MNEGFEGGYENTGKWSEVTTGGTVVENFTLSGTPPAGSCSKGLNVVVSEGLAYAKYNHGSAVSRAQNINVVVEFYVDSVVLTNNTYSNILSFQSNETIPGSGVLGQAQIYNLSGSYKLRCVGNASNSAMVDLTQDAWHTLVISLDADAAALGSTCTLDGGAANTFTRFDGSDPQYLFVGFTTGIGAGESRNIEIGRVYIDTP